MPCTICNGFEGVGNLEEANNINPRKTTRNYKKSEFGWNEFLRSAKSCYICDILVRGIRGCFRQHNIEEHQLLHCSIVFYYQDYVDELADGDKEVHFRLRDGRLFETQVFVTENDPVPSYWEYMPVYDRTSGRTDSDEAFSKAKSWLLECISSSHEFCDTPIMANLPKRVVDVGADDKSIRLIETQGQKGSYMCLSHCWGGVQIITSTQQTLQARMAGIAVQDLSDTFRDAIIFTRRLGIQYIWIDSLCIIQDDPQDWKIESAKMMDIYNNAYLTIAATFSHNGDGGLFIDTPDVEVGGFTPQGDQYRVFFREKIDHHIDVSDLNDHPTLTYYPLLTRAWVYQERLLSTRVLHFGHYELFFECRSVLQCECSGIEWHGSSSGAPVAVTKLIHADALDSESNGYNWHVYAHYYIARLWRTMVSSYTGLDITKAGDRLPAVGGLARHMAIRRKSTYLAGLWEDTLSDDLLWAVWTPFKKPRPSSRTAPTWSWASVDNHILYGDEIFFWDPEIDLESHEQEPFEHFANIKDCKITPAAIDAYGEIGEGHLQVSGLLIAGKLEREVQGFRGKTLVSHYIAFPGDIRLPMKADYLLDEPGPDLVPSGSKVFCLRMSRVQNGTTQYLISLVLRLVGSSPETYARIGTVFIEAVLPADLDSLGGIYLDEMEATVTVI